MSTQTKERWLYTPKKISFARCIGFAMNDLNGGAWGTLTGSYLMFFLTTYGGLSPLSVGTMFFTCKMLDILVCAVIGSLSDNLFKFRIGRLLGRRHLLMLIGAVMIAIGFPLLFQTAPGGYWWYFIVYFLIDTANALIGIAYETLPVEMTKDADERVKLSSVRLFVSAFSTFAVTALPALLLSILPSDGKGNGTAMAYTISGIVFGIVFSLGTLITFFSTWEFSPEHVESFHQEDDFTQRQNRGVLFNIKNALVEYKNVWNTKSCRRIFVIYFISYFAKDCYATAFLYFIVFILGMAQATGQLILSLSFIGMIVVPIATYFMVKKGPKFLWTTAYGAMGFVLLSFFLIQILLPNFASQSYAVAVLIVLGVAWQVGRQIMEYTCWNVIPLAPDVDTLVSTKLRAGTFASVQTFSRRATGALGSALIGLILEVGGFDATAKAISSSAKLSIIAVFIIIPAVLISISFYLIRTFNLNQRTHEVVMSEITRLQEGGSKESVDPSSKEILENLCGYKYEELWDPAK